MSNTRKLVIASVLCALAIVSKAYLTIFLPPDIKVSATAVPVMLTGIFLGPVFGGLCGIVTDILGTLLSGLSINPGITFSWALFGIIPSLFFIKNHSHSFLKLLFAIIAAQIVCSFCLNTLFLTLPKIEYPIIWGEASNLFLSILTTRVIPSSISLVLYFILMFPAYAIVKKYFIQVKSMKETELKE